MEELPGALGSQLMCFLGLSQDGKLGQQVSVFLGHTGPVTFLDFCEAMPDALLSSSIDGTCRIWGVTHSSSAIHILAKCPLWARSWYALPVLRTALAGLV